MRDRLAKWIGIKMPSKAIDGSDLLAYGRGEAMTEDDMKKLWDSIPSVNHPPHYSGDIECIDAMIQTKGVEKVKAFCELCAFKYLWRSDNKGGDEDIEKAVWYLEKYLELGGAK